MIVPFVRDFFAEIARHSPLPQALLALAKRRSVKLSGLTPSAQMMAVAMLRRLSGRPVLLVVADNKTADERCELLQSFQELTKAAEEEAPLVLPAFDLDPYEGVSPHDEILERQAVAVWKASQGHPFLIVPALAALLRWDSPQNYRGLARTVRRGDFVDLLGLAEHLATVGYRKLDPVELPGQFSVRGGLLDVFSPEAERPVRLELFGDEIESLREFDPNTQRSIREVEQTTLLPLTALPLTQERSQKIQELSHATDSSQMDSEDWMPGGGTHQPGWEFLIPGIEGFNTSVFDLARNALIVISEPELVTAEVSRWWRRLEERVKSKGSGAPVPESIFFSEEEFSQLLGGRPLMEVRELTFEEVDLTVETLELQADAFLRSASPSAAALPAPANRSGEAAPPADDVATSPLTLSLHWPSRPSPRFQGAIPRMIEEVRNELDRGNRLVFVGANVGEVERLTDLFNEYSIPFQLGVRPKRGDDYLTERSYFSTDVITNVLVSGTVPRGFVLPEQKVIVFGHADLFRTESQYQGARAARGASQISSFLSDFRDLSIGDYVVHVEHGIGKYLGLKTLSGDANAPQSLAEVRRHATTLPSGSDGNEFMVLEYADQAKLYVPLTRMDLVQKYRSAEGAAPVLDRLGSTQWQQRKARVKKAMKDMADELIRLYAERQAVQIQACGSDSHWQREFEDAFPYTETPDQERAIEDVRRDLQTARPMDRLLVGDVGYGKTEVAMRASFKVVNENRQAAVLVPTTVLAFQHFETFRQRFAAFPVTIEMLSSFRTPAEQRDILQRLANGKIDIIIGTHRLLSKDVKFQHLGLVVVDEEQRFGVRHKERLKQLKREVHVLAMSATPIPRTLNMSLAGLRDMSVIETPPKDRLAIQTVVAPFDEKLIRAAIENEMERGGQVYFVHNRVDTIWEIAALVQKLVPQARVAVAHGQMGDPKQAHAATIGDRNGKSSRKKVPKNSAANTPGQERLPHTEAELERVMLRFIRHEADVLVSTTIIENGLDIPLANTMIVNRADRLGLSELYQLRGRVGRSNRRAYAYLLVPEQTELTPLARKRLAALREFSDLGAGFKIAALDLELRGAGNLLGGEQSGHIEAVGFDLYVQMLERTVRELRGQAVEPELDTQIHLGLDIRIPPEYIAEENQRLRMYKRLAEAETPQQQDDVVTELSDRYGPPPAAVHNLLLYAALKVSCRRSGIQSLERRGDILSIRFSSESPVDPQKLAMLVSSTPGAQFTPGGILRIPLLAKGSAPVIEAVRNVLAQFEPAAVAS